MTKKPCSMIEDNRKVANITSESSWFAVGDNGVTEIVIYQEPGQMAMQNYAAIYCGDFLYARVDLAGWKVFYKREEA